MQNGWNDDSGVDAGVCATPAPAEGETSFSFRAYTLAGLWVLCLWGAKCLFVAWIPLRKLALTPWLIDDSFISCELPGILPKARDTPLTACMRQRARPRHGLY